MDNVCGVHFNVLTNYGYCELCAAYRTVEAKDQQIRELQAQVERLTNMIDTWRKHNDETWQGLMDVAQAKIEEQDGVIDKLQAQLELAADNAVADEANLTSFAERNAELEAQVERVCTTGQALLDATGHSTWQKLFKAPSVEYAISDFRKALEEVSDES